MKTEIIIVSELFEKPRRYLIPIFQRGYVWTRDNQWAPLWEDLINLVEALKSQRYTNTKHFRKHFLGAIVLQSQILGIRHTPVSDVIDGQQRLLTLQLLLVALRDNMTTLSSEFLSAKLDRLTQNPGPYTNDDDRFKVWPTSVYREDFSRIALAGSVQKIETDFPLVRQRRKYLPRPQLVEAYLFFYQQIKDYISSGGVGSNKDNKDNATEGGSSDEEKIQVAESLLEAITNNIQLVEINLTPEDDPQIIFETLNARGVPLSASDLIRNFIFLYASRNQESVVELYERHWKPFDETPDDTSRSKTKRFWKEEERQGRFKTNRLDLFFYHYLTYKTEADIKIGHIFQEFKDWWDDSEEPRQTENELAELSLASGTYRRLITPRSDSRFGRFASLLRVLDTTTIYPAILFLEAFRDKIGSAEVDGIYIDIESYLIRRIICGMTPKNYNRIFLSLLQNLNARENVTRADIQQYLLSLEGETVVWPTDEIFKLHFMNDPLYAKLRSARTQLILESIERGLASSFQETIEIHSSLSIEHIWPQNPAENEWPPIPKNDDGTMNVSLYLKRLNLINSLGNLTLVTPSFNSSLSNKSYKSKHNAIVQESRLRLNAYFHQFDSDAWIEEDIIRRGEVLYETAKKMWPRPSN